MRSITKQLDMSPGAVSPVVHVSQYDSDFTIVFNLYCTDGTFTIESGTTAEVRGTKKSGTGYSASATVNISAKTVTVTGHKQMTAVAGDNIYEITLYKGSKELNSINFILAVERAAMDQDTVTDETVIREFGELETYIEGVKADTAASASAAQASQTAAAASAQESAQSAIEAAQSAQSVDAERLNRIAFGSYVVEESTGPIAHFEDGADNIPMKDVLVHIEPVQEGSGDPSPDNVRAITGWTGAKVTRCGKNLFPKDTLNTTKNGITIETVSDGVYHIYGTASAATTFNLGNRVFPRAQLILSGTSNGSNAQIYMNFQLNGVYVSQVTVTGTRLTATVTPDYDGYDSFGIGIFVSSGKTVDEYLSPMLRLASDTDSAYEPYSGDTYTLTFPTSAGTVYGGTLDVTSGMLTVDRKMLVADGSTTKFSYASSNNTVAEYKNAVFGFVSADALQSASATVVPDIMSDTYKAISYSAAASKTAENYGVTVVDVGVSATARVRVAIPKSQNIITLADANTWLENNPLQIVYPLATPITYQLTPQEIKSLLGENTVWADTGDSEVEYRADTKMYVDAKVAAAVSALS